MYGQSTFFWLSGEQAGDFPDIIFLHPVIFQGAEAAYHGHTGAALVFHGIDQADDTHFTGQFYMGSAAGADIVSRNFHNANLTGQFFFAAVIQLVQFFFGWIGYHDRKVLHNCFIGLIFHLLKLLWCKCAVEIHGYQFLAQMEADIIISEGAVHDAGNDMLAGVLLHFGETLFIVDRAIHFCVGLKFSIGVVDDQVTFFLDVQHLHAAQNSGVGILAAALREEYGLVENYFIALFFLIPCTGQYRCVTAVLMAVCII